MLSLPPSALNSAKSSHSSSNYQMPKPTLTEEQKQQLLDRQFRQAMSGDTILLVHLGKTELGQAETHKHIVEALPFTDRSRDEILDLLAERAKELADQRLIGELVDASFSPAPIAALPAPPVAEPVTPVASPKKRKTRGKA
jgi:hypothetical protein